MLSSYLLLNDKGFYNNKHIRTDVNKSNKYPDMQCRYTRIDSWNLMLFDEVKKLHNLLVNSQLVNTETFLSNKGQQEANMF